MTNEQMEFDRHQIVIISAADVKDKGKFLGDVIRVEQEAWPEEIRATRDKFESRLETFPHGFLAIYVYGQMMGVSTSEMFQYDLNTPPISWKEITDNGYIRNVHREDGNALYVVSLGVSSRAQGRGLGSRLIAAQQELAKKLGLKYLVLGARLPGYRDFHKGNQGVSAQEYLEMKKESGEPLDPEIRFYSRSNLKPILLVENYMEDDPESENYGVVMCWTNET